MSTRSTSALTLLSGFLALLMTAPLSFAEYNTLDAPALSMSIDYPKEDYQKILAVLKREDCKFLSGAQLNASTSLRYGGNTIALNKFIGALARCPNTSVHVKFYRPTGGAVECDWMVTHMGPGNQIVVRVNLASNQIDMEKLHLPPMLAEKEAD